MIKFVSTKDFGELLFCAFKSKVYKMKRYILSLFGLLALSSGCLSQTITLGDMTPVLGDIYVGARSNYVSPGMEGENQIWDLSDLNELTTFVSTHSSPEGLPGSENFSGATFAFEVEGTSTVVYSEIGNNKIEDVGLYRNTGIQIYDNPHTALQFPLSFQTSYSDTFESTLYLNNDAVNHETGLSSAVVDGYGTLITPTGTFGDVLRLKYESESEINTFIDGEIVSTMSRSVINYLFLKAGYATSLAVISNTNFSGSTSSHASYYISSTVGLDNVSPISDLTIFPVPAENDFTLNFTLESAEDVIFNLFSIDGRMVAQLGKEFHPKGQNTNVLSLPQNTVSGVYLLQIKTSESIVTEKIVVQ